MSNSGAYYVETLEIEQRKLSSNSNGHNFPRMSDSGTQQVETLEIDH